MRNVSLHIKILFSVPLVGLLYWRDLVTLWQMAFSPTWISFTLSIFSLVLVFLYQDRKALKTLLGISESDNKRGAVILILAIISYILSPYTAYMLWLRLCSLGLFITAYLTLIFDFRVSKTIFTPLIASLLAISPHIEAGLQGASVTLMFMAVLLRLLVVAFMVISVLFRFSERAEKALKPIELCPLCRSSILRTETFCPLCGRLRSPLTFKVTKGDVVKLSVLLSIICVLSFAYITTSMVSEWSFASQWMLHERALNQIYARFKDTIFTIFSVTGVFLLAGLVKAKDEKTETTIENTFLSLEDEAPLLATVSAMKQKRFTGAEVFDSYKQLTKSEEDVNQFYERLAKLSKLGLLRKGFVNRHYELVMVWERNFP